MSTQRRENRWQQLCTEYAAELGHLWLVLLAGFVRIAASVGTAPQPAVVRSSAAGLATNSLQSGHLTKQLVRQASCRSVRSAPPLRAARRALRGVPATRRSSLPLTPTPSVLEYLHPSLPHCGSPLNRSLNQLVPVAFS